MSIIYLKVKIKSLAAEQRIIRHEERKQLGSWRWLRSANASHRINDATRVATEAKIASKTWAGLSRHRLELRPELRAALIAYAYLRGRSYRSVEPSPHWLKVPFCKRGPDWDRVEQLVLKFGPIGIIAKPELEKARKKLADDLKAWRSAPLPKVAA